MAQTQQDYPREPVSRTLMADHSYRRRINFRAALHEFLKRASSRAKSRHGPVMIKEGMSGVSAGAKSSDRLPNDAAGCNSWTLQPLIQCRAFGNGLESIFTSPELWPRRKHFLSIQLVQSISPDTRSRRCASVDHRPFAQFCWLTGCHAWDLFRQSL